LLFIPLKQQLFRNANTFIKNNDNLKDNNYMSGLKDTFELQDRFIVDIGDDLQLFGTILDFCFLSGYLQPTLAVLQETGLLPIGHSAAVRNTCTITVFAVDILSKSLEIVWQQSQLPHDSLRLQTLSSNSLKYSLALITMNAILLVNSNEIVGIATNGFATISVAPHIHIRPWEYTEGIELDKSRWIEAHDNCIVGSLKDGRIVAFNFLIQEGLSLHSIKFDVEFLGKSGIVSTICVSSNKDCWFMGSRTADSFLMGVSCTLEDVPSFSLNSFLAKSDSSVYSTPASKKAKKSIQTPKTTIDIADLDNQMNIEQTNLYGSSLIEVAKNSLTLSLKRFALSIVDTIPAIGPILSGVFCSPDDSLDNLEQLEIKVSKAIEKPNTSTAGSYIAPAEAKDFLKLCAGVDDEGAVFKVNRGFKMSKIASRGFPGAVNVSTITLSCNPNISYMILSYVKKTKVLQCFGDGNGTELPIKEIVAGNTGFVATEMTLKTGFVAIDVAVQVHEHGLRTIKFANDPTSEGAIEGNPLQDVIATDSEELGGLGVDQDDSIASCSICYGWIAVITSKKKIFLLQYDATDEYLNIIHKGCFVAGHSNNNSNTFESYITSIPVNISLFHGIFPESNDNKTIIDDDEVERDIQYLEQIQLYGMVLEGNTIIIINNFIIISLLLSLLLSLLYHYYYHY